MSVINESLKNFIICVYLIICNVEHLLMCFFGYLYVFIGEIATQKICPFFDWVFFFFFWILRCVRGLYILEMNLLSGALFENIFSHSEDCLFVLFIVSFAVQKHLSLIRCHLFILVFIFITLGGRLKKNLL